MQKKTSYFCEHCTSLVAPHDGISTTRATQLDGQYFLLLHEKF